MPAFEYDGNTFGNDRSTEVESSEYSQSGWGDTILKRIAALIKLTDQAISRFYLKFFQEKNSLVAFMFHALFRDEKEIRLNHVDPQEGVTVELFRRFVEYFLNHGYTFVSPEDVIEGLSDKKCALISFDDGYFSGRHALPILKEYQVPAVFFVLTHNIEHNKCSWWDVLYREGIKRGTSIKQINSERQRLRLKAYKEIENDLMDTFGAKSFEPISDIDRPFTASELKKFCKQELVFVGNHTSDHTILTNCPPDRVRFQMLDCQKAIHDITGSTPVSISYPGGDYSNEVITISKEIGLKVGFGIEPKKNYLPISSQQNGVMCLGRFALSGSYDLTKQCEMFRSDVSLYRWARKSMRKAT